MLRIKNLHAYYGRIRALENVSLHVRPGEIVSLIGANGAGKTTLLNSISGLIPCAEGEIYFEGRKITGLSSEKVVAAGISQVPEGRQIFHPLTVLENLQLGAYLRFKKKEKKAIERDMEWIFELFPRLKERVKQIAGTLSGGEQQMLAIGRALMARPKLLLLDEPSMGLAPLIVRDIMNTTSALRDKGVTILMVEQNARAALRISDRGYVLETGRVILQGSSEEILNDNEVKRAYLGKDYKTFWEGREKA
ncbi:MAG: ABC transporter ATP-binding protein [Deltaproteobacteria bacterium]|nr:ABC transporter ATP-binding protein [Deltaproteobacteria bacterium]MCD6139101.1 ABC transporter ATP-binding protein [Deltaproteobacteria bacterium]RLB93714.1 MAG: branched-chain amino acid ABC transporter ATP-binding protein [Deltaproteobacteria bacterium]RLC08568.1 MAG: branched-chain amino acid ABC transporter ATP-binding protein [Deltaproteobacteria bacterium]